LDFAVAFVYAFALTRRFAASSLWERNEVRAIIVFIACSDLIREDKGNERSSDEALERPLRYRENNLSTD
jgi:hypothetical protein